MYETYKFGEWAFYMSVKRQMVKKKIHNQSRMNKLLKMGKNHQKKLKSIVQLERLIKLIKKNRD